jgi:proteic killer suppression protein
MWFRLTDSVSQIISAHDSLVRLQRHRGTIRSLAVARFRNIERVARRKPLQLHAASEMATLRVPPGNQLEALKRDRKGQQGMHINDQWRICFRWDTEGAHDVEIVDYH